MEYDRRQARVAEQSARGSGTSLPVKQETLIAWTSLYIAVGIMALICAALSTIVTLDDWRTGRWAPACTSTLDKALLLPKLWLHWQANYLTGTPVILAISLYYASSIGFSVFRDI
ncbi:hypothetical protein [Sphingomonas sp. CCH10-B3]|uniref:hypothetical protein n=1 Tax=Sphingomonas sp. CCH10-B3 TaxID=1768757 RepID=UPI001E60305E|nr:hypothetical protein [Sphingomonas sp. CCH10-B3]